jgi:hypothetical protein
MMDRLRWDWNPFQALFFFENGSIGSVTTPILKPKQILRVFSSVRQFSPVARHNNRVSCEAVAPTQCSVLLAC